MLACTFVVLLKNPYIRSRLEVGQ